MVIVLTMTVPAAGRHRQWGHGGGALEESGVGCRLQPERLRLERDQTARIGP